MQFRQEIIARAHQPVLPVWSGQSKHFANPILLRSRARLIHISPNFSPRPKKKSMWEGWAKQRKIQRPIGIQTKKRTNAKKKGILISGIAIKILTRPRVLSGKAISPNSEFRSATLLVGADISKMGKPPYTPAPTFAAAILVNLRNFTGNACSRKRPRGPPQGPPQEIRRGIG